jgi:tellurite resistance protein
MNFFPEIKVETHHAEAIARGLFAIAHADGLHEREAALIASFWSDAGGKFSALAELERSQPIGAEELGGILNTKELRHLFVKTALLMAFADGKVSGEEKKMVRDYADKLGLSGELAAMATEVRDFLLSQLAHLHNTNALSELAKQLNIEDTAQQAV